MPKRYEKEVEYWAENAGVEPALVYAVIRTESNFRPDAISSAGATGLMQIMPSTARFIESLVGETFDALDAEDNITMGTYYLQYLFGKFEELTAVLAAYNAGEGTVRAWLSDGAHTDSRGMLCNIPYPETAVYVKRVKNFYNCYKFAYC